MFGFLRGLVWGGLLAFGGWVLGSIYPAPPEITEPAGLRAQDFLTRIDPDSLTLERLQNVLSDEDFSRLREEASQAAAAAGDLIMVERDSGTLEEQQDNLALDLTPTPQSVATGFEESLSLCPRMTVVNAPARDGAGRITPYNPRVNVNGVALAVNPTAGACLSSGFGPRSGRTHKGLDFYSDVGGVIMAAADGVVIEKVYRDDYGNMLLIDHGGGVHTRYAHLSTFEDGIVVGARVSAGQPIGLMGNTASYPIPIHLHYELLLGDYANPRASFGLTPRSPFEFPRAT